MRGACQAGAAVKQKPSTEQAVLTLKQAAKTGAVPAAQVCGALVQLEKEKLAVSTSPSDCLSAR